MWGRNGKNRPSRFCLFSGTFSFCAEIDPEKICGKNYVLLKISIFREVLPIIRLEIILEFNLKNSRQKVGNFYNVYKHFPGEVLIKISHRLFLFLISWNIKKSLTVDKKGLSGLHYPNAKKISYLRRFPSAF